MRVELSFVVDWLIVDFGSGFAVLALANSSGH